MIFLQRPGKGNFHFLLLRKLCCEISLLQLNLFCPRGAALPSLRLDNQEAKGRGLCA